MPTKKIILDNAYVSWQTAIKYCDAILDGRSTLLNRKNFVSSLQNAVELFIKQIMLNNTDYRVAEVRNVAVDGTPAKDYYASTDLNSYFENVPEEHLKKFYSIDFNRIITIHKEVLRGYLKNGQTFKTQLSLLTKLRNNETHFYIKPKQFLSESEFVVLYNFMIDFYDIIQFYDLLPYWGDSPSEYEHLEFKRQKISSFSYVEAAKNSKLVKELSCAASELTFGSFPGETAYSITDAIISCAKTDFSNHFNEAWEYMEVLDQYGLIEIQCVEYEVDNDHPEFYYDTKSIEHDYFINIKI